MAKGDVGQYRTNYGLQVEWADEAYRKVLRLVSDEEAYSDRWLDHVRPDWSPTVLRRLSIHWESPEPIDSTFPMRWGNWVRIIGSPELDPKDRRRWRYNGVAVDLGVSTTLELCSVKEAAIRELTAEVLADMCETHDLRSFILETANAN